MNKLYIEAEPVAWVTAGTVDGQAVNGKPRRVWWENKEGCGMPIFTSPRPVERQTILNLSEAARSLGVAQAKDDQGAIDYWSVEVTRFEREARQPVPELSKFLEKEEWNDAFAQGFNAGFNSDEKPAPDVAGLVDALEEIIHPIRFMQERLGEGEQLNGMVAVQLAEDAEYLRGIAIAALEAHRKGGSDNE